VVFQPGDEHTDAQYLRRLRQLGTYIGGTELTVLASIYSVELRIWSVSWSGVNVPSERRGSPVVEVVYNGVNHYDAVVPEGIRATLREV
jgi:hypothetical protein